MTQTIPEWTLGWRLQRSLAHAGISIDDMAKEIGVSRQTISRWVNDHSDPRIGFLKLWALRTGVPLEWLVSGGSVMFDKRSRPADLGAAA